MQVLIRYNYLTFWRLLSVDDPAIESPSPLASGFFGLNTHRVWPHGPFNTRTSLQDSWWMSFIKRQPFTLKVTRQCAVQSHKITIAANTSWSKDTDTLKIPQWPERLHRCPVRVPITLCWFKTTDRNVHTASFHQVYWSVYTPHSVL